MTNKHKQATKFIENRYNTAIKDSEHYAGLNIKVDDVFKTTELC